MELSELLWLGKPLCLLSFGALAIFRAVHLEIYNQPYPSAAIFPQESSSAGQANAGIEQQGLHVLES